LWLSSTQKHGEQTAIAIVADVTKSLEAQSMIEVTVKTLGPLTVMMANAAIA
jgi:NAD(P)-dependent dehydrogenase (short-subunit alcohol dehydrogenase family)